jgi:hypothetical protein
MLMLVSLAAIICQWPWGGDMLARVRLEGRCGHRDKADAGSDREHSFYSGIPV